MSDDLVGCPETMMRTSSRTASRTDATIAVIVGTSAAMPLRLGHVGPHIPLLLILS